MLLKRKLTKMLSLIMCISIIIVSFTSCKSEPKSISEVEDVKITYTDVNVISSVPENNKKDVPLSSPIAIFFDKKDVNIKKNFSISPNINGDFICKDDYYVFVPHEKLESGIVYTVTVKSGKNDIDKNILKDYTFSFTTEGKVSTRPYNFELDMINSVFATTKNPKILFSLTTPKDSDMQSKLNVNMYKIKDKSDYISCLKKYKDIKYSSFDRNTHNSNKKVEENISKYLTNKIDSFQIKSEFNNSDKYRNNFQYIKIPKNYKYGYYIAELIFKNPYTKNLQKIYQMINISDLSVFVQQNNNNVTAWVNDIITKKSCNNANVSINNIYDDKSTYNINGKTDKNGLTDIKFNPKERNNDLNYSVLDVTDSKGNNFIDLININNVYNDDVNLYEDYFKTMYFDRTIYKNTDTINFWGVIKPKTKDIPTVDNVIIKNERVGISVPVKLNKNGTFTGSFDIKDYNSDNICVDISFPQFNNKTIYGYNANVNNFELGGYDGNVDINKKYFLPKDNISSKLLLTHIDGTPMDGATLINNIGNRVITNNKGEFNYTINALKYIDLVKQYRCIEDIEQSYDDDNAIWCDPQPYYLNYKPTTAENSYDTDISSSDFWIFPSEQSINIDYKIENQYTTLTFDSFMVDLNNSLKEDFNIHDYKQYKGKSKDVSLNVEVKKETWNNGNQYIYDRETNTVKYVRDNLRDTNIIQRFSKTIDTKDGIGTLTLPNLDKNSDYHYVVTTNFTDDNGNKFTNNTTIYNDDDENQEENDLFFSFKTDKTKDDSLNTDNYYNMYVLPTEKYLENENINVLLKEEKGKMPKEKGKMLYIVSSNKRNDYKIIADNKFTIQNSYAKPNIFINGAYFVNGRIFPINPIQIKLDVKDKVINTQITTDKDNYSPGQKVSVTVKTTDINNKAVKSDVLLSVVDEDIFNKIEDNYDIVEKFFSNRYRNTIKMYYSKNNLPYNSIERYCATGCGAGGAGYDIVKIREDFKYTSLFKNVSTNEDGIAKFEFIVPDNITTWRLTALSSNSDKFYVGQSKKTITSTLPFYIKPLYNTAYIDGDDIALSVSTVGSDTKPTEKVTYTSKITKDGKEIIKTSSGNASEDTVINFGKLPVGNYEIMLSGKNETYSDAVKLPIKIIKSGLKINATDIIDINKIKSINSITYPVEINIINPKTEKIIDIINSTRYCDNKDISEYTKASIYETLKNFDIGHEYINNLRINQSYGIDVSNNIPLINNKDKHIDIKATAKAYMNFNDFPSTLEKGIRDNTTSNNKAYSYLALSSLNIDVKDDIITMLSNKKTSTLEKLYLIQSLIKLGDKDTAQTAYNQYIKPIEKENNTYIYIDNNDYKLCQEQTAMAMAIMSSFDINRANKMADYILGECDVNKYTLELTYYLQNLKIDTPYSVDYIITKNGEDMYYNTKEDNRIYVNDKATLNAINIDCEGNDMKARVFYTKGIDDLTTNPKSDTISFNKNISIAKDNGGVGNIYNVTLTVKFDSASLSGSYDIFDLIPSNCRYYNGSMTTDGANISNYIYKQKIHVLDNIDNGKTLEEKIKNNNTQEIKYQIIAITNAEAITEKPVIFNNSYAIGTRGILKLK